MEKAVVMEEETITPMEAMGNTLFSLARTQVCSDGGGMTQLEEYIASGTDFVVDDATATLKNLFEHTTPRIVTVGDNPQHDVALDGQTTLAQVWFGAQDLSPELRTNIITAHNTFTESRISLLLFAGNGVALQSVEALVQAYTPPPPEAYSRLPKFMTTAQSARVYNGMRCPKCREQKVLSMSRQTRTSDEGETTFCKCDNCSHSWRQSS